MRRKYFCEKQISSYECLHSFSVWGHQPSGDKSAPSMISVFAGIELRTKWGRWFRSSTVSVAGHDRVNVDMGGTGGSKLAMCTAITTEVAAAVAISLSFENRCSLRWISKGEVENSCPFTRSFQRLRWKNLLWGPHVLLVRYVLSSVTIFVMNFTLYSFKD